MSQDVDLLENHVRFVGGGTPSRKQPEYYNGTIPWVTVKDLGEGLFLHDTKEKITLDAVKNSATNVIAAGNILICTRMAVGKAVLITKPMAINQDMKAIFHSEQLDTRFLLFFLRAKQPELEAIATGATVKGITLDELRSLQLPILSIPEQEAIAQRLERADRLRRLRQHALTTGDQYLQNVFLDMFGDPETNPKGWEREELGELMAVPPQIGTTQPAGGTGKQRCVRVGEIGSYYVDLEACGFVNLDGKNLRKYRLEHEDLLLARAIGSLDHLGKMSIVHDTRDDLVYDSHVMRLRLDSSRLLPRFLMTMLVTPGGRSLFLKQARRTAVQFNVNADQMRALPVIVPKISEQQRFVTVVQKHERLRRMQVEALRQAEQLYETLLDEAFGD